MRLPPYLRLLAILPILLIAPLLSPCRGFDSDILGIQTEDFFNPPGVGRASLSPDGTRVAYTKNTRGFSAVHIEPIAAIGKSSTFQGSKPHKETISFIGWKDNQRIVFQTNGGNIYLMELQTYQRTLLWDAERLVLFWNVAIFDNFTHPRILSLLADDPKRILISAFDPSGVRVIYKLELREWSFENYPKPYLKNPKKFDAWHLDNDNKVRLATKFGKRQTELFYAEKEGKNWTSLDKLLGRSKEESLGRNKANIAQPRDYLIGFSKDNEAFYFASNRESDTFRIYLYDPKSAKVIRDVAYDPNYDLLDLLRGEPQPIQRKSDRELIGFYYQTDKPTVLWIDEDYKGYQAEVDALLPDSSNILVETTKDEKTLLVRAIRSDRPVELYAYNRETKALAQIGKTDSPIDHAELQKTRPISYLNRQGDTIHGYFTPAKAPEGTIAPMVMLIHGGPWVRDTYGYDPMVQCLSHNGFSVMQINYRGSTGYGYKHYYASVLDYGIPALEDIDDGRKWSIVQGLAQEDRIAIMGFSYGGYASALAATHLPDAFRCAIPMAGLYDLLLETKSLKEEYDGYLIYESWKKMVGTEWSDKEKLKSISPINHVDRIKIPILLTHGKRDKIVDIKQAELLKKELEKHGVEHEYIVLEEEGHSILLPKNQAFLFEKIVAFLNKNL